MQREQNYMNKINEAYSVLRKQQVDNSTCNDDECDDYRDGFNDGVKAVTQVPVDIVDIRTRKEDLERSLGKAILDFENETGCEVLGAPRYTIYEPTVAILHLTVGLGQNPESEDTAQC
jgi:hypothetical protein